MQSKDESSPSANHGATPRSGAGRAASLGGALGGLAAALLGAGLRRPFQSAERRSGFLEELWIREAERLVEKLGQLKGAAMKFGQMLSLHDQVLPPEAARILSRLQRSAPSLPFDAMRQVLNESVAPERLAELVESIDPEPFAAASIGQVHRARLRDGRDVVFKLQYPGVDRAVRQDLRQLRWMAAPFVGLVMGGNPGPVFDELEAVIHEELDYERELENLLEMERLLAGDPERVIPRAAPELSGRRALCLEFAEGLSFEEALSEEIPQALRDQWAAVLARTFAEGVFSHRFLHADPNAGNFAFRKDGRVAFYDFGCVKRIPPHISTGYRRTVQAMLEERDDEIPEILRELGIHRSGGRPIEVELLRPHAELFRVVFAEDGYRFGADRRLHEGILELGRKQWFDSMGIAFPREILFIHRTLGGTFGNFTRLRAAGPWRSILLEALQAGEAAENGAQP